MTTDDLARRLADAQACAHLGDALRRAAADARALAIADEAARRGRGGARAIAAELEVSEKAVSEAVRRSRGVLPDETAAWLAVAAQAIAAGLPHETPAE